MRRIGLKKKLMLFLEDYDQAGIIEEVPSSELDSIYPTCYLPHRPIVRESRTSNKVRPVFDASTVSYNHHDN